MHVLIVHCHPEPTSFGGALTATAREALVTAGHAVTVSDLYGDGFDPVEAPRHYRDRADAERFAPLAEQRHAWRTDTLAPEVVREIERLRRADLVILQFPLWWHAQPAMLKGWFDRVFVSGGLYTGTMRYDRGFFRGRRALCSVTSGAPAEAFGPGHRGGDPAVFLWPIQYSLHYLGFDVLAPQLHAGVQGHGHAYRDETAFRRQLERQKGAWAGRLQAVDAEVPIRFPGWADWDTVGRPHSDDTNARMEVACTTGT